MKNRKTSFSCEFVKDSLSIFFTTFKTSVGIVCVSVVLSLIKENRGSICKVLKESIFFSVSDFKERDFLSSTFYEILMFKK